MIIIPACLNSSRLKEKLLLPLGGVPIIIRVANIAKQIDETIVACDDKLLVDICKKHGVESILTSNNHKSGTDRCGEVVSKLQLKTNEIIINLQGDEPFIEHDVVMKLKHAMQNHIETAFMASCYKKIDKDIASDTNVVKVVLDSRSYAIYFSRSMVPYSRDSEHNIYYGHLGIYAFSAKTILEFCKLQHSPLEEIEKLEQLRALWHKKDVLMVQIESKSIGIDTEDDYVRAIRLIKETDYETK